MKSLPVELLEKGHRVEIDGRFRFRIHSVSSVMFGNRRVIMAETTTGTLLSFSPVETVFVY